MRWYEKRKPIQNFVWTLCLLSFLTRTGWIVCLSVAIGLIVHVALLMKAEKGARLPYAVVTVFFAACLCFLLPRILSVHPGLKGPSEVFIDVCDQLFAEGSDCKAIEKSGNDVTEQFLRDHREEYRSGDYAAIWEAITNSSITITTPTEFGKAGAGE